MSDTFDSRKAQSYWATMNYVRPIAPGLLGGGEIENIEYSDQEIDKSLDRLACIDAFYKAPDGVIYPICIRNSFTRNFEAFTVGATTADGSPSEYDKIIEARDQDGLIPKYRIHSYVSLKDKRIISMGIAWDEDVIWMIENGHSYVQRTLGNKSFHVVRWKLMTQYGRKVWSINLDNTSIRSGSSC